MILGACNPLLPCNVAVYAADQPGKTVVTAINPESSLARVGREDREPVATEVKERLEQVLAAAAQ